LDISKRSKNHDSPGGQLTVLLCGLRELALDDERFVRRHYAEIELRLVKSNAKNVTRKIDPKKWS
jgi:hypothetical protein